MLEGEQENERIETSRKGKKGLRVLLLILLIFAPIILLMVIFTPIASEKIPERIVNDYRLKPNYQAEDLVETVKKMRLDPDFVFYFWALDSDQVAKATYETYEILDRARTKELLLPELEALQEKVKAMAVMFYHMDYSDEFISKPDRYPDLKQLMDQLVYQEFKLALGGLCYKSNYDKFFRFSWSDTELLAAQKLHRVLKDIRKQ